MKSLFDRQYADEITARISRLSGTATPQWGKMSVAQAAAHCADALEVTCGDRTPPRMLIGRLLGWVIKPMVLRDDKPMRPNAPTTPDLVIADTRDFEVERDRLRAQVDRFVSGGASRCDQASAPVLRCADAAGVRGPAVQAPGPSSAAVRGLTSRSATNIALRGPGSHQRFSRATTQRSHGNECSDAGSADGKREASGQSGRDLGEGTRRLDHVLRDRVRMARGADVGRADGDGGALRTWHCAARERS